MVDHVGRQVVQVSPEEVGAGVGLGDDRSRAPSRHTEEQVEVVAVVLVLRPTVDHDVETDVVVVDRDAELLPKLSHQRGHQVLVSFQMTGRQSQLPVAVAGAGPTQEEHAVLLRALRGPPRAGRTGRAKSQHPTMPAGTSRVTSSVRSGGSRRRGRSG
jgi:hypothetical protein